MDRADRPEDIATRILLGVAGVGAVLAWAWQEPALSGGLFVLLLIVGLTAPRERR